MAFPTTAVLDNFNRTDENPVGNGNWSGPLFSGDPQCRLLSNELGTSADFSSSYWSAATFGGACEVYATNTGTGLAKALFLRIANPNNASMDGYELNCSHSGNTLGVYRVDDKAETLIGSTFSQAVGVGAAYGLEANGSTLTVYYKASGGSWTSLGTRSDSTYSAAGNLGVFLANGDDDIDDFGGGTMVAAGGRGLRAPFSGPFGGPFRGAFG